MNIGILGAGRIAATMAETINGMDDSVRLLAIGARDAERAAAFASRWNCSRSYGSYEELASDPDVDLIYIATPHSHHFEHAKLCVGHGKAVLVEKSFTANAKQAAELLRFAEEKGVLVTEAIWTRYMPSRRMINDLIGSGVIGEVTSLQANLGYPILHKERMVKPELAGGALLDLGVYPINFALMCFGDRISRVEAGCTKLETGVDAQDSITLYFEDGKAAFLYASMLALSDREGVINGTDGYIEVQNINNPEEIRVFNKNRECIRTVPVPEQVTGYEYEVLACRDALADGRLECPEMPHAETIRVMELMDGIRADFGVKFPFED
ncbi:MAG: Gfo/Idh/MocA family oxidoreductase [Lachnospiraceae bacterium]|nr:Gfo/Idh/MocA family oxidoreductase [Lachnospiraceae bacterium]